MITLQKNDDISIATIRTLAADIVAKSNSGHPGLYSYAMRMPTLTERSFQELLWAWRLSLTFCSRGEIGLVIKH